MGVARPKRARQSDGAMTTQWFSEAFDPMALPEGLVAVYDYWLSKRSGGNLPSADSFDFRDLPLDVQPYVAVLELSGSVGNSSARILNAGAKVVELYGAQRIGEPLSEVLTSPGASLVQDMSDSLLSARKPLYVKISNSRIYSTTKLVESLLLPLLQDGAETLNAIVVFHWQE